MIKNTKYHKIINAKEFITQFLPQLMSEKGYIPVNLYNCITSSELLKDYITSDIVKDWLKSVDNFKLLIDELEYIYDSLGNKYHLTTPVNTKDIDDFIEQYYKVNYINDDMVELQKL